MALTAIALALKITAIVVIIALATALIGRLLPDVRVQGESKNVLKDKPETYDNKKNDSMLFYSNEKEKDSTYSNTLSPANNSEEKDGEDDFSDLDDLL